MRISEVAAAAGVSIDTIRFYEKEGLLDTRHVQRLSNNYRAYTPAATERLRLIHWAKVLGFTLAEIKGVISEWETNTLTDEQKEAFFCQKLVEIDQRIQEMERMKAYLHKKLHLLRTGEAERWAATIRN